MLPSFTGATEGQLLAVDSTLAATEWVDAPSGVTNLVLSPVRGINTLTVEVRSDNGS